jgi:hypothetical protein
MATTKTEFDPFAAMQKSQQQGQQGQPSEFKENLNSRLICPDCREDPPNLT